MEIQQLTQEELNSLIAGKPGKGSQKGCSALPQDSPTIIEAQGDNTARARNIKQIEEDEKRRQEEMRKLEAAKLEKTKKEEALIISEFEKIKNTKDTNSEATKKMFKNFQEIRAYLDANFEMKEKKGNSFYSESVYVVPAIQKAIRKVEQYRENYSNAEKDCRIDTEKIGKTIYIIMTQLYDGVLIDNQVTIRKTGIYPYRCQSRLYPEALMGYLIDNRTEILQKLTDIDKANIFKEILLILDKLNLRFKKEYGQYSPTEESRIIYLPEPYLIADVEAGYGNNQVAFSYVTGLKLSARDGIGFVGIHKDEPEDYNQIVAFHQGTLTDLDDQEKYRLSEAYKKELSIEQTTKDNLLIKFSEIIRYLYEEEIEKSKEKNNYLKEAIDYLNDKGSKFLILASFNEELQGYMKYL